MDFYITLDRHSAHSAGESHSVNRNIIDLEVSGGTVNINDKPAVHFLKTLHNIQTILLVGFSHSMEAVKLRIIKGYIEVQFITKSDSL